MMNFPNADVDIVLAQQETPELGLGVHLTLTAGRPLTPPEHIPTLVGSDKAFFSLRDFLARLDTIDPTQIKVEWRRQIEQFVDITGRTPTHLDSHHHSAYFRELFFKAMLELAAEYGCAVRQITAQADDLLPGFPDNLAPSIREFGPRLLRKFGIPTTDEFVATFFDKQATKAELLDILHQLSEPSVVEVMCHPGYSDAAVEASSSYNRQRQKELAVLTDPIFQEIITDRNIFLTTFAALLKS